MSGGWQAFVEWASMGRYGWHVWGAYLFGFAVLGALAVHALSRKRRALRMLRAGRR